MNAAPAQPPGRSSATSSGRSDETERAALADWLARTAPGVELRTLSAFVRIPVAGDDFKGRLAAAVEAARLERSPQRAILIETWNSGENGIDAALLPTMRRLAFYLQACKRALGGGDPARLPVSAMWAFWNRASPHGKAYAYPAPDV